jgi:serine/threonine protein kinase
MKPARDSPALLSPGATFGGYRVGSLVARGGMASSTRALDISLERPIALKLIAPELPEGERFRARFLREPRLAASLDHPSVVPSSRRVSCICTRPGDAARSTRRRACASR